MMNFCLEEINQREDYGLELSGSLLGIRLFISGPNSYLVVLPDAREKKWPLKIWDLRAVKWNAYGINSTSDYEGYWRASVLCRAGEKWEERPHKRVVNYFKDELASFNSSPDNEISIWAWGCCIISGISNKIYSTIIFWVLLCASPWARGWRFTEWWAAVTLHGEVCVCWREVESGEQYRLPGGGEARSGLKEVEGLPRREELWIRVRGLSPHELGLPRDAALPSWAGALDFQPTRGCGAQTRLTPWVVTGLGTMKPPWSAGSEVRSTGDTDTSPGFARLCMTSAMEAHWAPMPASAQGILG